MRKLVLTGGPCSGKSSILQSLAQDERLSQVIEVVPEVATLLLEGGWPVPGRDVTWTPCWQVNFQRAIVAVQPALEEVVALKAQTNHKQFLVCDRGLFDGGAYLDGGQAQFCRDFEIPISRLLDYDLVIHLESLAVTQPDLYGQTGNDCRFEDVSQACELDAKVWQAWLGHSNHVQVSAQSDLETKFNRVIDIIHHQLEG